MEIGRTMDGEPSVGFGTGRRGETDGFRFGLEAEYLVVEAGTYRPLRQRELDFATLNAALEAIGTDDLPAADGLALTAPHRKRMPFYVEGYHLPDPEAETPVLLPKGIEVRTPACASPEGAVTLLGELIARLQGSLAGLGLRAVACAHHPIEARFRGPRGRRSLDRWRWAQQAMLTYGPDVNVSLPGRLAGRLDLDDLHAKVNAYAPALVAPSLAAPLSRGRPWRVDGRVGKSIRTHRRSPFGPALRAHDDPHGRLEFKGFDMSHRLADLHGFLLLWLAFLLDDGLGERATDSSRISDLGAVARDGLTIARVRRRAAEVLDRAPRVLAARGFDPSPLDPFAARLIAGRLPADEILDLFEREGTVPGVLRHLDAQGTVVPAPASIVPALAC
jgi:Glutamate-cysteine ligase family 2(GCS2)